MSTSPLGFKRIKVIAVAVTGEQNQSLFPVILS